MKDLKPFLTDYNTRRSCQPSLSFWVVKVLLAWSALQILSFLCLTPTSHGDWVAKAVQNTISFFNLPYFCMKVGIPLLLPFIILLLLHIGYSLMTLFALFVNPNYQQIQRWSIIAICKLEHYFLNREVAFLFTLAMGMEAIFRPENFVSRESANLSALMSFGITLAIMSVLLFYWRIYIQISVSYRTESVTTEHRSGELRVLRGLFFTLISVLAYAQAPVSVFVCVGIYLLIELFLSLFLGTHSNIKINNFSFWIVVVQVALYSILLFPFCVPITVLNGKNFNASIGILLLAPLAARFALNLERRRTNFVMQRAVKSFSEESQGLSWWEIAQVDVFLRQTWSKFTDIKAHGPEIYQIIETIIRIKKTEEATFLYQMEENLMEKLKDVDPSKYIMKIALTPSFYDFINSVYSSIISRRRKFFGPVSIGCYLSYIAFHKDITGNYGKALIILAQLQKALGSGASARTIVSMQLAEHDLQRLIAGSGTQKTISADLLFSFLDRSEKVQTSIENYISQAFSFYELLQKPVINTKDIKTKGKKLLNERTAIIKELDSLVKINEYHQQTLLLYEFFLSEIVEEKAEGRFFQIKNRMDIFRVAEYYTLYRQQKLTTNTTELETLGWDMSIEFFANQLDDSSDYSVIVFSLNPENVGRIMRCSTNLYDLLEIEEKDISQISISDIESTLFSFENLKTLQDHILKGEINLKDLAEKESSLYLKHRNGSLIAYSFVADVEIYGRDPCITCYLRRKKVHEQDFILFSLENEAKLIGMSKALLSGTIRCKPRFNEIAKNLYIADMIPTLEEILPIVSTKPTWSESEALLIIPQISRLSITQAFYMINYTGKIQTMPLLKQKIGIIEIQYSEPISLQLQEFKPATLPSLTRLVTFHKIDSLHRNSSNHRKNQTRMDTFETKNTEDELTGGPSQEITPLNLLKLFKAARAKQMSIENLDSQKIYKHFQSLETESKVERKLNESLAEVDNSAKQARDQRSQNDEKTNNEGIELVITAVKKKRKPKAPRYALMRQNHLNDKPDSSISSDSKSWNKKMREQRNKYRQQGANKEARTEKITLGRASSVGSSIGAHMGFLRSIIIERKTPAVLTAVNLFGLISLISTVSSVLVAYFILKSSYGTFTLFAQSASFPSIMRAISPSYTISAETQFTLQYLPAANRALWQTVAYFFSAYFYRMSLAQNNQFVLNFDLPSLSNKILNVSIPVTFSDFPELNRNLSFYEANTVFQTFTYKFSKYNYSSGVIQPHMLDFTRTFLPAFNNMYEEISNENFNNIYELHDSSNLTLDVIMVAGVIISILLMVAFIPIYWRYQKMEVLAFTKLCNITLKELQPSLKKITVSYEQLFGKTLSALQHLQENADYHKKKSKESSHKMKITKRRPPIKKSVTEKSSNLLLVTLILFVSLLLSATYIVINVVFKNANAKILPFLTDLEKVSAGLPSCFTAQAAMTRIFNEIANPNISHTLPALIESYQGSLNESLSALKDMNNHLIGALKRAESTDVLSNTTKEFFRNLTDSRWCNVRFDDGTNVYSYCIKGIKGVAASGFMATQNKMLEGFTSQINKFALSPTLSTIYEFYFSPDVFDFMIMNLLAENYMLQMLKYEQIDVGKFAEQLHSQTHLMLALGLLYNVVLLAILWVPTISYLRKRFIYARSIFLLVPTQVLLRNSGVNNLFKVW